MNSEKKKSIQLIVDTAIGSFAEGLISRYTDEADDVNGVINMKKNNCFIAELGKEFMFYSAFAKALDNILLCIAKNISKLTNYCHIDKVSLSLNNKKVWNNICNDNTGFEVVFQQYKYSINNLKNKIKERIRI